ncbi:MAG: pentapeptide repeat-containing protein [Flavobacteriaceae bacterium]
MDERIHKLEEENQLLKEKLNKIQELSKKKTKQRVGLLRFIGHAIAGKKLKNSIYNLLDEYNVQKNVTRETLSDFLASIIHRITRIGVFTLLFALFPSALLLHQNFLLKQQNKKIQDQTHLAEASRRSAQMFIMGEVLSDINTELNQRTTLSDVLVGRIISLSHAMKPYRYIVDNELIEKPISPERGQLLITLAKSNLNKSFFVDNILQQADFTQAELTNTRLPNTTLRDVNLTRANVANSDLENTDLSFATLTNTDFTNVDFTDAILKRADFTNANLTDANLRFAVVEGANFTNTNLNNVKVHRMDWLNYISGINVTGAEQLKKTYEVDSIYFEDLRRKVPTLIRK